MAEAGRNVNGLTPDDQAEPPAWGLFLKRGNLSNRQDAKVAKANTIHVSVAEETMSEKLGVLGVLAVKTAAHVKLQEKTMEPPATCKTFPSTSSPDLLACRFYIPPFEEQHIDEIRRRLGESPGSATRSRSCARVTGALCR
ncbi:MAG: hypothetical protein ACOYOU_14740 [Kiritimatiellia bacterium]